MRKSYDEPEERRRVRGLRQCREQTCRRSDCVEINSCSREYVGMSRTTDSEIKLRTTGNDISNKMFKNVMIVGLEVYSRFQSCF